MATEDGDDSYVSSKYVQSRRPGHGLCVTLLASMSFPIVIWALIGIVGYRVYSEDADTLGQERRLDEGRTARIARLEGLIRLGCALGSCCWICCGFVFYWCLCMRSNPQNYVPVNAVVPDDMKGRWQYGLCDCGSAIGTFCCFCWCPLATTVDLWYKAGWIHGVLRDMDCAGLDNCCVAWQYFAGVGGLCAALDVAPCCMCCAEAILRGGFRFINDQQVGDGIVDHYTRFGLPHAGWSTFCLDCCLWWWCTPCVGTQEYQQIMSLLKRGPLQLQVVGQAVHVQGTAVTVVGQAVGNGK